MLGWLILGGLILGAGLLTAAVLANKFKAACPQAFVAKITECHKTGNYNKVNAGLYDNNHSYLGEYTYKTEDSIDENEIYEGAILYLN